MAARSPWLTASAACIALACVTLPAATSRMPVDEIERGMRGVGVTVFEGVAREEFEVEVLGVLANVMGPRRTLILVRLAGGPLAQTGVIQGMSGSPVYIDDRLIGAVSYAVGSFATEPIAGITPIDEMAATDASPVLAARHRAVPLRLDAASAGRDSLAAALRQAFSQTGTFARRPADVHAAGLPPGEAGRLGTLLRPISTPLVLNGFVPEVVDLWSSAFDAGGFVTTIGGAAAGAAGQSQTGAETLQPGDAVGAVLMRGDLTMAGTGTVTLVEEDRIYAFGHPFYNLGSARLPMTRAHVTTLVPSLANSSKITRIGDVVGTIDQDRPTGVYGSLGPGPELIPVSVSVAGPDRGFDQRLDFEIIDDPYFTPVLTLTGVLNTLLAWTRDVVPSSTYAVAGTVAVRGHEDVAFRNVFAGPAAGLSASTAAAAPLISLLDNRFERVAIDRVDIAITAHEEPRTATLERVRVDAPRPRAGDTVPVTIAARTRLGEEIVETVPVTLPRNVTGRVQILVADAATLRQREALAGRQPQQARSLPQLIRALSRARQQDRFYIQLLASRPGAVVRGQPLTDLPPSVLAILDGDRAGGDVTWLRNTTLGEWEAPTGYVVSGSRVLTLSVEAG